MPKSKRERVVPLTKTEKKGREAKNDMIDLVRQSLQEYDSLYVFSFDLMRTKLFAQVRKEWPSDRFFLGRNKVMQVALGKTQAEELAPGSHNISARLQGTCGLLFTNKPDAEVRAWFSSYSVRDFARSGCVAESTVELPEGLLDGFQHTQELQLRKLGLPTKLIEGKVCMLHEHTVCTEGRPLTPEQATMLQLLDMKQSDFKLELVCRYSDGQFETLDGGLDE